MIRASVFLLVVGLVAVASGFGVGGRGSARGNNKFSAGGGSKASASGVLDTSGRLAGKASVGKGSAFGGLFDFGDLSVEGEAEGGINAEGTAGGQLGGFGQGQGSGEVNGQAGVDF